jgi:hypothetical protein
MSWQPTANLTSDRNSAHAFGVCLSAEFFAYWLHRLLHSDKIPCLSRGHLIHHFLIYGPGQPMRLDEYHDATDDRFSVGNVGLEWLVPSAMILTVLWASMRLAHLPFSGGLRHADPAEPDLLRLTILPTIAVRLHTQRDWCFFRFYSSKFCFSQPAKFISII